MHLWLLLLAAAPDGGTVKQLEVTILSTMLADEGVGEWGFSALVVADGHRLLFDTGARPATVSTNAAELHVDLTNVRDVVLSHDHDDHTGGLVALRKQVRAKSPSALSVAHVGRGIFWPRREGNPMLATKAAYTAEGGAFVEHDAPTELWPGVWLTGPVPRRWPERNWSGTGTLVLPDGGSAEDDVPEDQALVVDTPRGLVVVSGCGHAGVVNTLEYARRVVRDAPIHAVIGGLHLFALGDEKLGWTGEKLKALQVEQLVGAHCTGLEPVYRLRAALGLDRKSCVVGAVGARFVLGKGIDPLRLAR